MRELFASNMREQIELAKEHFSIMKSENTEGNLMFEVRDHESVANEEVRDSDPSA